MGPLEISRGWIQWHMVWYDTNWCSTGESHSTGPYIVKHYATCDLIEPPLQGTHGARACRPVCHGGEGDAGRTTWP